MPELGLRILLPANADISGLGCALASEDEYHARRIALGVPEGGRDYSFGDAFPHEAMFDQLNGVDFKKGCFVGQEVVSRMEHRGTARKRIVGVEGEGPLPTPGTEIIAGSTPIGTLGSVAGSSGLALLRLDRAEEAKAAGVPLRAGEVTIAVRIPAWARFKTPRACRHMSKAQATRCPWAGSDPLYVAYHDEEWGVPKTDARALFEKLVLEGFQAGLAWITILRKREAFRAAFDNFDAEKMASYGQRKVASLLKDEGIVRHRGKIEAAISNAKAFIELEFGSWLQPIPVGLRRRQAEAERLQANVRHAGGDAGKHGNGQGAKEQRLPLLRADHAACLHAERRHGQRPSDDLLPSRRMR